VVEWVEVACTFVTFVESIVVIVLDLEVIDLDPAHLR
jgi:hypothetical protein